MNNYELTVILRNKELDSLKEKVQSILQKHEVKVIEENVWGNKRMAYEIDNEREGYYIIMNIEAAPEAIDKIISNFRLNSDILRYLFVKSKSKKSA